MKHFLLYLSFSCILLLGACAKSPDSTTLNVPHTTHALEQVGQEGETAENASNTVHASFAHSDFDTEQDVYFDDEYAHDEYFDDEYFDDYSNDVRKDPLIKWNKTWFAFNDFVLLKVLKPTNKVYTKVVPQTFRNGIKNLRYNLKAPLRMGNAVLQGEFKQFFIEFGKLMINVMTSAGLADVASLNKPLYPSTPENLRFGYTLAKWHVPQGPYLILPFFGPSTPREGIGTIADMASSPVSYLLPWEVSLASSALMTVNDFASMIKSYELLKDNAFDPYISLRNAYLDRLDHNEPE